MRAGLFVREARRRAGLTQAELAQRAGTTQSAIARLERGGVAPSMDRVRELVEACGFEVRLGVVPIDGSERALALSARGLSVDQRVLRNQAALRFARAGRDAMRESHARGRA